MLFLDFLKKHREKIFLAISLIIITLFLLSYFEARYILSNTTPTGGDTPAHNYLARHLKETLFSQGSVISYAKGFWCGFPMFQYYFFFPYFLMAILSWLIPINIAFKIVSILGIIFLPGAVYFSFSWLKFDRWTGLISAIFTLPFLFAASHTMWGVNIYSTLAGEISNSISFVFFVLFLGSFYKDLEELRFRLRTVVLFTLLFYSHFFTSVMAAGCAFFLLLFFKNDHFMERALIYLKTNALTFLLAAWWLVPLLAKRAYSMEFGGDWDVVLLKTFPPYSLVFLPPALFALALGIIKKKKNILFVLALLLLSILAFYLGGKINASFTNIRFWPFIYYALICLAAIGLGELIKDFKGREIFALALLLLTLTIIASSKNDVRAWVKWNNEGLESKSDYATFRELILPLDNTKGRLANDLHEYNNHFGSSRVFETVPALINKDILEGGIVNSATGSMFSYYIQGETSKTCAGFPTVVNPTTFNLVNATKHLELANVKHFIAYWETTRQAMRKHPDWKLLKTAGQYQLFELTSHDGSYVYLPKCKPLAVKTKHWPASAMEWLYTMAAIDTPFILVYGQQELEPDKVQAILSEEEYLGFLSNLSKTAAEIPLWLSLGPFYFPAGTGDQKAIELEPVKINELKPEFSKTQFGKTWQAILRHGPIFLDGLYQPKHNFISYHFAKIDSAADQAALLHYSHDDYAKIYLNGQLVVSSPITGLNNYKAQKIQLKKGENTLLYKLEQSVGGVFFHVKITDLNNRPLAPRRRGFPAEGKKGPAPRGQIIEQEISDQRISFKTSAIGQPHIIKFSYFPNWQVRGAKKIYHVTPNFMLVYPDQAEVTLYYGSTFADIIGRLLTSLGGLILLGAGISRLRK